MTHPRGLALFALVACAPPSAPDARTSVAAPPSPGGPSVLLVTLDTTRADHLGAYGDPAAPPTPTFDALAARGTLFLRATSSAPLTIPSHATILTGRFPPSHGVRDNGNHVLPADALTLAERFAEAGYTTAAFTAAFPTSRRWGFDQGFHTYSDPLPRDPSVQDWRDERPADEVIDAALAWLVDHPGPSFVWVHLFDAHWPYQPPEPFRTAHADRPYAGEVAFADAQLGRLVDALPRPTVIAVTADHGEALGAGGEGTHGFLLHDATIRVPLVLAGPGVGVGHHAAPVSHVDLAPTLLALAGLPLDDRLQGRDLRMGGTREIYSEATTGRFTMGLSDLVARTDAAGRLTRGAWSGWYPVDGATGRIPVTPAPEGPPAGAEAALDALRARLGEAEADRPSDPDATAALAALGYLAGDPDAPAGALDPRDVIANIPRTWEVRRLLAGGNLDVADAAIDALERELPGTSILESLRIASLRARGDLEQAASRALGAADHQDTAEAWRSAGEIALEAGWLDEADDAFRRALEAVPTDARSLVGRVRVTMIRDGADAALPLTEEALAVFPDLGELNLLAGEVALGNHQPATALAHARRALERDPLDPWALSLYARSNWDLGRPEPAIDALQQARRELPRALDLRLTLTDWLLEVGRRAEALRAIRPAAAELPGHPEVQAALARAEAAGRPTTYRSRRPSETWSRE